MAPTIIDNPPFRAEHVGSLLRPPTLMRAREEFAAGRIARAALRVAEDIAIREAVAMQERVGMRAVTDGEYRRASWHMDFLYQVGGVERVKEDLKIQFRNEKEAIEFTPSALKVSSRMHLDRCIFGEDFSFLKSIAKATPKLSIPSPSMMHYRGGRAAIDSRVYPDIEEFWSDLAEVYANQIDRLSKLGCTYVQLDDTSLAYLNDPAQRDYIERMGGDGAKQHLTYIRTINAALARRPAGISICTHSCRGNFRSSWVATGGYDHVAEALFNDLNVDGYFLEFDDERSGGFEPLRFVPKGKRVVLGLVSSKRGALEGKDDLKRRIDAASRYLDLDQLCLSPQCGFASTVEGNLLTADEQEAKLRLVIETAREVWG
jgi:5-methyltetrahydropteroyltriglutamate--homocysteine methyltransferase